MIFARQLLVFLNEAECIEQSAESDEIRQNARYIREATNQLLRITNDVLDFVNLGAKNFDDKDAVF